jgi:glutamate mutase epsilon subunit
VVDADGRAPAGSPAARLLAERSAGEGPTSAEGGPART